MNLVVRAFPVLKGKLRHLRALAHRLKNDRAEEGKAFYSRHGVARESWHLQELGPDQYILICVTQIPDKPVEAAAAGYAKATETFDRWFKQEVRAATGIDPNKEPLGPRTECLFDLAESAVLS